MKIFQVIAVSLITAALILILLKISGINISTINFMLTLGTVVSTSSYLIKRTGKTIVENIIGTIGATVCMALILSYLHV
jgi:hypothetical protein